MYRQRRCPPRPVNVPLTLALNATSLQLGVLHGPGLWLLWRQERLLQLLRGAHVAAGGGVRDEASRPLRTKNCRRRWPRSRVAFHPPSAAPRAVGPASAVPERRRALRCRRANSSDRPTRGHVSVYLADRMSYDRMTCQQTALPSAIVRLRVRPGRALGPAVHVAAAKRATQRAAAPHAGCRATAGQGRRCRVAAAGPGAIHARVRTGALHAQAACVSGCVLTRLAPARSHTWLSSSGRRLSITKWDAHWEEEAEQKQAQVTR